MINLYRVGLFPMKGFPPHRGHITSIINAATQCEKLYVLVCDNNDYCLQQCKEHNLRPMDLKTRARWLSIELQGFNHIKIVMMDELDIPSYPNGWPQWTARLNQILPEPFDVIFGGEPGDISNYNFYYPSATYVLFDYKRERYPLSATIIRDDPMKYWDYILGAARPNFAKRVLLTGTESCGKSTLVKYLGKIYHTSWTEEVGRYYSGNHMGGNEEVYTINDFERIAYLQWEADIQALKRCNKVVFFDTDATVTQYYLQAYLAVHSPKIESYIDSSKYDVVLMFKPDVPWIDDGQRFLGKDAVRWAAHEILLDLYNSRGFKDKIIEIDGSYSERLTKSLAIIDNLIK